MNYIDEFGRIHSKPVTMLDPLPCNNAFIYSAYMHKLGGEISIATSAIEHCIKFRKRHPVSYKITQQMSRDEWIALAYFARVNIVEFPIVNHFAPVDIKLPKFNFFKTAASFVLAVGEHRNFLHQKQLLHSYKLLFMVPLQDRAFIYRLNGLKVPFIYRAIEAIDKRLKPKNNSSALIRFLKYNIKPNGQVWIDYFGSNHPITAKAMELYK